MSADDFPEVKGPLPEKVEEVISSIPPHVGVTGDALRGQRSETKAIEMQPVNNALTRLIDRMHDAVLDTEASSRPAGNLMDAWMDLKAAIERHASESRPTAPGGWFVATVFVKNGFGPSWRKLVRETGMLKEVRP